MVIANVPQTEFGDSGENSDGLVSGPLTAGGNCNTRFIAASSGLLFCQSLLHYNPPINARLTFTHLFYGANEMKRAIFGEADLSADIIHYQ